MEPKLATIQVDPMTAATLHAQAAAQGISVDEYLRALTSHTNGTHTERPFYETATTDEWIAALNRWAEGHDQNSPGLTLADVSRESIYDR